jgi:hypothetical protein
MAIVSMVCAAVALLLLVFSVGVGYPASLVIGAVALGLALGSRRREGRPGQARAAVILAGLAVGLSIVAAIVWLALQSSGYGPDDLQRWLEDELRRMDQRRSSGAEI